MPASNPPGPSSPPNPWADFEELAKLAPKELHEAYSQKLLRRSLWDLGHRQPRSLGRLRWEANGRRYGNFAQLLLEPEAAPEVTVHFIDTRRESGAYEFNPPSTSITFRLDGHGTGIFLPLGDRTREQVDMDAAPDREEGVVRFALREAFVPRPLSHEQATQEGNPPPPLPFGLFSWRNLHHFTRRHGVVPYRLELLLYLPETRVRYELDLLSNRLLQDPRTGRLPLDLAAFRSTRLCAGFDRFVARLTLPLIPRRALEILFESRQISPQELASCLEISLELSRSALETLRAQGLAEMAGTPPVYLPVLESYLTPDEWARERAGGGEGPSLS
jgi:hypothetical protein